VTTRVRLPPKPRRREIEDGAVIVAIHEVAALAARAHDPAEVASAAVERARELLRVDCTAVFWWNQADGLLHAIAENRHMDVRPVRHTKPGSGVAGVAFQERRPVVVNHYPGWEHAHQERAGTIASAMAVPLHIAGRVVGALVAFTVCHHEFGPEEVRLISIFAAQLAPVLEVGRLLSESERQRIEAMHLADALRASEERFASYFRDTPVASAITTLADGRFIEINDDYCRLFGYERAELIGRTSTELGLWPDADREDRRAALERNGFVRDWESHYRRKDGQIGTVLMSLHRMEVGGEPCIITGILDITQRKRSESLVAHQAGHDALTGLPNRSLLRERLVDGLRTSTQLALLFMDLDRFKEVNDTFGHDVGDKLLQQVADRMAALIAPPASLARLGGDEFAVVVPGADRTTAIEIATSLGSALKDVLVVDEFELSIGVSIGIALAPTDGTDEGTLLRRADIAMYDAKHTGHGSAVYSAEQDQYRPERLRLIAELRRGIGLGELRLHYQPVLDLRTDRIVAAEALVRWQHPTQGLLLPADFVPLSEQTGLIKPLTDFVLMAGIGQAAAWRDAGRELDIAINLSVHNLLDPQLPAFVDNLLDGASLEPDRLVLEITEGVLMSEPERMIKTLHALRGLGVRLAVDDFGSGYSSIGYLQRLPVQQVKIDRSFTERLATKDGNRVIVESTIAMAHGLGLEVVAEGVEDRATLTFLKQAGCDYAQGYSIGRPAPAEELA
jgi:diguanylate cyclase (GGDEF)-like protein/PAS domain S-box-containing protein